MAQGIHLRKYGAEATIDFEVYEVDGVDLRTDWTPAAADCEIMKDGGASTQCTNTATDEGSTYSIVLTSTEMQAARLVLKVVDAATKVFLDKVVIIETYGHASAQHALDLDTAIQEVDVIQWEGAAINSPTVAGVPEVDLTHMGGVAQSATDLKDFADAGYDPATNKVQGVVLADTVTALTGHTAQTGDSFARIGATGSGLTSLAQASLVTAARMGVLDDWLNAGRLDAILDAIKVVTDAQAATGTGLTAIPWNAAWDAEVQSEVADALTAYGASTHDAAAVLAAIQAAGTHLTLIKAVTDAQAADGSGLSAIPSVPNSAGMTTLLTRITALLQTKAEADTAHGLLATPAQVNTEVVDVLKTDTIAEQAQGIPPTTPTFEEAVMYLYMALTKSIDVDATLKEFYNNAGTVVWKKTVSDDGTNYVEAKGASGP